MVVDDGETTTLPGVATPPIPLSISTASAFVTAPQVSDDVLAMVIVAGDAENEAMFGVPLHVGEDGAADDDAGAGTLIFTVKV